MSPQPVVQQQPIVLSQIEAQLDKKRDAVPRAQASSSSLCCCSFLQPSRRASNHQRYILQVTVAAATVANIRRKSAAAVCTVTYQREEKASALSSIPAPRQISFIGRGELLGYYKRVRPDGGVDIDRIYGGMAKGLHSPESICMQLKTKYGEAPAMQFRTAPCPQLRWNGEKQGALTSEFKCQEQPERAILSLCEADGQSFAHAYIQLADLRQQLDQHIQQRGAITRAVKRTSWLKLKPTNGTLGTGGAIKVMLVLSTQALEAANMNAS
jgi:hypothetical protein